MEILRRRLEFPEPSAMKDAILRTLKLSGRHTRESLLSMLQGQFSSGDSLVNDPREKIIDELHWGPEVELRNGFFFLRENPRD